MGKKEFDEYLKKQRIGVEAGIQIDWGKKRDQWLGYLDSFYKQVEGFLSEYTKSGDVRFDYSEKDIHEEFIGQYRARALQIRIKNKDVLLDPVGTNLIGAKGRVDMSGDAGKVRFVLVDKDLSGPGMSITINTEGEPGSIEADKGSGRIEWTWKIATSPPRVEYIEMNAESFFDALMEVVNA